MQVLFLGELEEILELTQTAEFTKTMVPMFRQIARCLNSSHFQVAERALFLWNNDYIVSLVAQNRHTILPMVFGALQRNARSHWNAAVHGTSLLHAHTHQNPSQAVREISAKVGVDSALRNMV